MEPETLNEENNNNTAVVERPALIPKARRPMETLLKNGVGPSVKKAGDIVEGVVLERRGSRLFIDLGAAGTGIVYGRELRTAEDMVKGLTPGDTVSAKVIDPDNEEGYVELSLKEAGEERRWLDFKKLMDAGEILELPVKEANRGGLMLEFKGVVGFLPASQLATKHYPRVEGGDKEKIYQELQKLVGESLSVKIIDIDANEAKLIFSEKESEAVTVLERLKKYQVGDTVEGEVTGVLDFGAFVRFDEGVEGLVHISEIDWTLVEDPRAVLKVGDHVRAKVVDIQGSKVSLSLKLLKDDPWSQIAEKYRKGDMVRGVVVKHNPFGAFVAVEAGVQGLLHISEFGRVERMKQEYELGKSYDFRILMLDPKEHRMSLGMVREKKETSSPESIPSIEVSLQ